VAYRLGVFGFFDHPQLPHSNFALLDQLAALRWIKHNIYRFGGDRHQVTVSGESAGANNIYSLLASPLAQGLFQRVIHQSGGSVLNARTTRAENRVLGQRLADSLVGSHHATPLEAMRQIPATEVQNASEEIYAGHYFDPVIDGHSVLKPLGQALEDNEFLAVDLMIGTNADEWLMYLEEDQTVAGWLAENVSIEKNNLIAATLDPSQTRSEQLDTLITGYNFVCPSMTLAQAVARRGGKTWMYYFSRQRIGEQAATMGAYHGAELPYVFNTHDNWLPTDADDHRLTQAMMTYWAQFVKNGDPNVHDLPAWPVYKKPGDSVQVLDADITHQMHSSQALCSVLRP
jgi:para-nitrobenzyl esterase